jgi:hypothetical protein
MRIKKNPSISKLLAAFPNTMYVLGVARLEGKLSISLSLLGSFTSSS